MTRRFYAFPNFVAFFSLVSAPRSALTGLREATCRQMKPVEPVPTLHKPVDYPDGWEEA